MILDLSRKFVIETTLIRLSYDKKEFGWRVDSFATYFSLIQSSSNAKSSSFLFPIKMAISESISAG